MSRIYAADDAATWISAAFDYVNDADDEVIVERDGEPTFVIVSFADFEELRETREEKRRDEALQRLYAMRDERERNGIFPIPPTATPEERAEAVRDLRALREEVRARNQDLTQEEAEELADRFSREMIDDMVAEGRISFERDLPKPR